MKGYIKIHRKLAKHHLVGMQNPDFYIAWQWMLMNACWKPMPHDIGGKTVTLERGQLAYSTRKIAEELGWSKSRVFRFLERLKIETMIETGGGTAKKVITICNYDDYQSNDEYNGTVSGTPTGTEAGHERDTKEEDNNNPPIAPPGDGPGFQECLDAWNEMAKASGLATASLTDKRRKALRARLKDHSLEDFAKAVKLVPNDPFRLGQTDRGNWRANIDWLLRPDTITKLLEEVGAAETKPHPGSLEAYEQERRARINTENYRRARASRDNPDLQVVLPPLRPDGTEDLDAPKDWGAKWIEAKIAAVRAGEANQTTH